jgi:chromosome segregation ATPase
MSRATQRLDDARGRCNQAQAQIRMATDEIQRSEERLRNANDAAARSLAEVSVARIKSQLQMFTADEQQCRVREAEADSQFRTERARMSELEDQLDKLDRILGTIGK